VLSQDYHRCYEWLPINRWAIIADNETIKCKKRCTVICGEQDRIMRTELQAFFSPMSALHQKYGNKKG